MGKKTTTAAPKVSKQPREPEKRASSLQEALTKNPPKPVPEGPDYLAQREKWFQQRSTKS